MLRLFLIAGLLIVPNVLWLTTAYAAIACDSDQMATANAALSATSSALDAAISAIDNPSQADADRLTKWLGVNSSDGGSGVRAILTKERVFLPGVTFLCDATSSEADLYAYVIKQEPFTIVLSSLFFSAPDDGFSSKPGTLVHEMSHFIITGDTNDPRAYKLKYGTEDALKLAKENPTNAQNSAENIEYFVEDTIAGQ